ncbi:MAG TPA: endonuclease/exonuclease/phosphatase family protein [Burkholderiales bacterium]|nr:endonuclease/exonuclease/phosphatase family protein [Burkholderiales bacterium]
MRLLTWNVQWCRGIDGNVDPSRIAVTARRMADFDVLCLQEVAVNFASLPGSRGEDQVRALAALFPGYDAHYGAATDIAGPANTRSQFGNLILSRLPVHQVFRHLLPWPADAASPSMQRLALEVVVQAAWGPVRITTTHLEYYSATQRNAQIEALRRLHREACAHARTPRAAGEGPFAPRPRPAAAIFTGDFNLGPGSAGHARMCAGFEDGTAPLRDAWEVAHPGRPHAPTVGIHENSFSDRPDCFDFIFLTPDLACRVSEVAVDGGTRASDHQPVLLALRD